MEFSLMHTAQRAIRRLAFIGWLGLVGLTGLPAHLAQAAAPPERVLPDNTLLFIKINDVKSFGESFRSSQYGQLWNDPALKDFRDELAAAARRRRQGAQGADRRERQRTDRDSPGCPDDRRDRSRRSRTCRRPCVVIADAGENQKKLEEVLERASKQAEEAGAKVVNRVVQRPDAARRRAAQERGRERRQRQGQRPRPRPAPRWSGPTPAACSLSAATSR